MSDFNLTFNRDPRNKNNSKKISNVGPNELIVFLRMLYSDDSSLQSAYVISPCESINHTNTI